RAGRLLRALRSSRAVALVGAISVVRRGLSSMTRLQALAGAAAVVAGAVAPGLVVAGAVRPAVTEGGLREGRPGSDTPVPSVAVTPVVPAVDTPVPSVAVAARPSTASTPSRAPGLRFSHLTFAYEGRAPALHDVSFEVAPGET